MIVETNQTAKYLEIKALTSPAFDVFLDLLTLIEKLLKIYGNDKGELVIKWHQIFKHIEALKVTREFVEKFQNRPKALMSHEPALWSKILNLLSGLFAIYGKDFKDVKFTLLDIFKHIQAIKLIIEFIKSI